jgi:methyl-accepting chemotaxis protein
MATDIASLRGSHDRHGKTLQELGSQVLALKSEIASVRVIAERADVGQSGAHRKISETQSELTGTLAAVQLSQNQVAGKAEKVAAQTDTLASETTKQSTTLAKIETASASLQVTSDKTEKAVEKITRNMPLINATAIAVATSVGYAVNAYFSVHH